jgi:hypothetical protein
VYHPASMPARRPRRPLPSGLPLPGLLLPGLLWLAVGVAVAGCGGADDRPPVWSFIAPAIIEPSCATASCHSAAAQRAGVVLDTRDTAYHSLVDRFYVIKGDPGTSALVALMRAEGSRRMPPDLALPEADIALIVQWIASGAENR